MTRDIGNHEMNIRLRICLLRGINKIGYKFVVGRSASSGSLETKIEVVGKKFLVVGPAV